MNKYIKINDLHYNNFKSWDFTKLMWYSRPYEYRWVIDRLSELSDNSLVLDAACGIKHPGYLMISELDSVKKVIAVDLMKQLLNNGFDSDKVIKVVSGVENYSYDEPFDIITCISSMEHMPQWKLVVQNFWNILKPGGYCILTIDISIYGKPNKYLQNWNVTPKDYKLYFEEVGFELVGDFDDIQYKEIITGKHTKFGPSIHHELSTFKFLLRKPNE